MDTTARLLKIKSIEITGNKVTKEKILRLFLQSVDIDTGSDYDSSQIAYAKQKLLLTNLFSKAEFLPIVKEDGVHLHVVVREVFYIIPDDVAAGWIIGKHGDSSALWFQFRFGATKYNFRGNMETFSIRTAFWDHRGLSLGWSKPILPSPYFLNLGGGVEQYPEILFPQNRFIVNGKISVSRRLSLHSRGTIGVTPMYTWVKALDGLNIDKFHEIFSYITGQIDFRNDSYDPVSGWYALGSILQNAIYAVNTPKYGQFTMDFLYYQQAFFKGGRFAFHLQSVLRTNDAGPFKRFYLGSDQTVRGFPTSYLGAEDTMNNYAMLSAEYRFPIYKTPVIEIGPLSSRFSELKGLYYELDGALIADAGHVWHDVSRPLQRRQNGGGIGVGLRVKAPTLRLSGNIDIVWPITKDLHSNGPYYNKTVIYTTPRLHFFVSSF